VASPGVAIKLANVGTGADRTEASDVSAFTASRWSIEASIASKGVCELQAVSQGYRGVATGETTTFVITLTLAEVAQSMTLSGEARPAH